jgi:plasmid stability protein
MAQLIVRNIEEAVVKALRRQAARHGRSAEAEHREILREALTADAGRESFKAALAAMPDLGEDADFEVWRDMPRDSA